VAPGNYYSVAASAAIVVVIVVAAATACMLHCSTILQTAFAEVFL